MKQLLYIISILAVITLNSCGSSKNTPTISLQGLQEKIKLIEQSFWPDSTIKIKTIEYYNARDRATFKRIFAYNYPTRINNYMIKFSEAEYKIIKDSLDKLNIKLKLDNIANRLSTAQNFRKQDIPYSIAILPPINQSNKVDAKEAFYITLSDYFIAKGYYVFPPLLFLDILRNEGLYDTETYIDKSLNKLHELFGIDAVLITRIEKWANSTIKNATDLQINYKLVSTTTGRTLYDYTSAITAYVPSGRNISGTLLEGVIRFVGSRIATKLKVTEYSIAHSCNANCITQLPYGYYSEEYDPYEFLYQYSDTPISTKQKIKVAIF